MDSELTDTTTEELMDLSKEELEAGGWYGMWAWMEKGAVEELQATWGKTTEFLAEQGFSPETELILGEKERVIYSKDGFTQIGPAVTVKQKWGKSGSTE